MKTRIKKEVILELTESNFIKTLEKQIQIDSGYKIQHVEWFEADRVVYISLTRKMKNTEI